MYPTHEEHSEIMLTEKDIEQLICPLIDHLIDGDLEIDIAIKGSSLIIGIYLPDESDRSKVIGTRGKVINALRTYFTALGGRHRMAILLEVIESNDGRY